MYKQDGVRIQVNISSRWILERINDLAVSWLEEEMPAWLLGSELAHEKIEHRQ